MLCVKETYQSNGVSIIIMRYRFDLQDTLLVYRVGIIDSKPKIKATKKQKGSLINKAIDILLNK